MTNRSATTLKHPARQIILLQIRDRKILACLGISKPNMAITLQEEMVLCIVKAAREGSTQYRQSSSLPPLEGNVPPITRNSISPIRVAFSLATPGLESSAPRGMMVPAPATTTTTKGLSSPPLSNPPGPKLSQKSTLMDSPAGAKAGDTSLPEFHVTSAGTPTPSPVLPSPLTSSNTVKQGKSLPPIRPKLPNVDSNEIRGCGSPGLAGSLAAQFQEVEASFGVESFVGQFEEVELVRQSAPLPCLEASYSESGGGDKWKRRPRNTQHLRIDLTRCFNHPFEHLILSKQTHHRPPRGSNPHALAPISCKTRRRSQHSARPSREIKAQLPVYTPIAIDHHDGKHLPKLYATVAASTVTKTKRWRSRRYKAQARGDSQTICLALHVTR